MGGASKVTIRSWPAARRTYQKVRAGCRSSWARSRRTRALLCSGMCSTASLRPAVAIPPIVGGTGPGIEQIAPLTVHFLGAVRRPHILFDGRDIRSPSRTGMRTATALASPSTAATYASSQTTTPGSPGRGLDRDLWSMGGLPLTPGYPATAPRGGARTGPRLSR